MIELVIAAVLQISALTTDLAAQPTTEVSAAPAQTTAPAEGGTGNWDDNQ